jgi:hypothetical protein
MLSKRIDILVTSLSAFCIVAWVCIFLFSEDITQLYAITIESVKFNNNALEKDSTVQTNYKSINDTSVVSDTSLIKTNANTLNPDQQTNKSHNFKSINNIDLNDEEEAILFKQEKAAVIPIEKLPKGREFKASDIPSLDHYNSRVRITTFFSKFKNGDFISGIEFSNLYRRDPTLSKLAKSTLCSFLDKNIAQLTRVGNSLVIHTIDPNGIHTKIKIPFIEDIRINIENGASIDIGEAFTSKEPKFIKSILVPIQLHLFDIVHNGEEFPTTGYISGDFYFVEYAASKMAYKLR